MAFSETLRIIIDANTKGFVTATRQAADSTKRMDTAVAGVKGRIGGFAKAAALGLAGVGVAALAMGDDFVRAAEESNKVTAQTGAVLKSMGLSAQVSSDQIAKLAQQLSLKAGVDDEVIQSGENVLLTFRNVAETAGESGGAFERATAAALDMSVALGEDMQSSVIRVGKALNDPIQGLTALRRAGVQFTAAQEDQIKAMVAAGDQAGAMNMILKELERQFGGSAEAQATASDKLSVAWENLQEVIGEKLLPVVEKFTTWLTKTGIPALEAMVDWVDRNKLVLLGLAVAVATVVIPTFVAWAAATIAATWPLLAIGAAVGVLAVLVVKHFDTIKNAVMATFNWIKENWPLILAILTGPIGLAVLAIREHWDKIRGAFSAGWQTIHDFFAALPGRIQEFLADAGKWLITGGRNILRGLWKGIKDIWSNIVDWFKDLPGKVLDALGISSPPKWSIEAGQWIMRGLTKGLGLGIGSVWDFMSGLAGKFIGPLKDAWDSAWSAIPILAGGGHGTNRALGQTMARDLYGWIGSQWAALNALIMSESGWNNTAQNPTSSAYGIGQFLDSTWASVGYKKTSDPATQIRAMLKYIAQRYGDPESAWAFKQSHNYYGGGGVVPGPVGAAVPATVHGGEGIFTPTQMRALSINGGGSNYIDNRIINITTGADPQAVVAALRRAGEIGLPITIRGRSL